LHDFQVPGDDALALFCVRIWVQQNQDWAAGGITQSEIVIVNRFKTQNQKADYKAAISCRLLIVLPASLTHFSAHQRAS
jgi:hypothetical protein